MKRSKRMCINTPFYKIVHYTDMILTDYSSSVSIASVAQGVLMGIMAIGVYITYKVLDFAD